MDTLHVQDMQPHLQPLSEIAKENFKKWNDALQTLDSKNVDALYFDNATFLPTLSKEFKRGQKGADEYFEHFLQKNPFGMVVLEEEQGLGDNCYIHSGMYNFEVGEESNRETVEARFTFVWQKDSDGKWKIIHHHSSLRPK